MEKIKQLFSRLGADKTGVITYGMFEDAWSVGGRSRNNGRGYRYSVTVSVTFQKVQAFVGLILLTLVLEHLTFKIAFYYL